MKEAGTKAMVFFLFLMVAFVFIVIVVVIFAGGDLDNVIVLVGKTGNYGLELLHRIFPKLAGAEL